MNQNMENKNYSGSLSVMSRHCIAEKRINFTIDNIDEKYEEINHLLNIFNISRKSRIISLVIKSDNEIIDVYTATSRIDTDKLRNQIVRYFK